MSPISLTSTTPAPTDATASQMPFGEYLFKRLQQVHNVHSVFGVPGDFNLGLLDHIYTTDLQWVGGCNELNAGYSADGYSRYTNSLGVVITTYGVGELSAMNAIAGAFAEYSKVLHIVGMPTRFALLDEEQKKKHIHHLVSNLDPHAQSDRFVYTKLVKDITSISRIIMDPETAPEVIDEVIQTIFRTSRPGVIFLPLDMADEIVDSSRLLNNPASTFHQVNTQPENKQITEAVADMVLDKLYKARNPAILADILVRRYDQGQELVQKLVKLTQFHNYTTFMGKSILDEYEPSFVGDYIGIESNIGVKENLEESDCVLFMGPFRNEMNTGHYTFGIQAGQTIELHPEYIKIGTEMFQGVHFIDVLKLMVEKLDTQRIPSPLPLTHEIVPRYPQIPSGAAISQSVLLKKFESFLQEGDVVVCETGSFMFGIADLRLKSGVHYVAQGFYLSIGMGLPSAVGVGIAMRDLKVSNRLVLVEGDGSAQMTIQELSSFPHYGLKPIIFLLNNSGYTVERIIRGETKSYNDIKPWNWAKAFELFEFNTGEKTISKRVANEEELDVAMKEASTTSDQLQFFEVILDKLDCPWRFFHMNNYRLFPLKKGAFKTV